MKLYDQKRKGKYISQMSTIHIENTIKRLKRNGWEKATKRFARELFLRKTWEHLPKSDKQLFLESLSGVENKHHGDEMYCE